MLNITMKKGERRSRRTQTAADVLASEIVSANAVVPPAEYHYKSLDDSQQNLLSLIAHEGKGKANLIMLSRSLSVPVEASLATH